jgi:hypothetical protein
MKSKALVTDEELEFLAKTYQQMKEEKKFTDTFEVFINCHNVQREVDLLMIFKKEKPNDPKRPA